MCALLVGSAGGNAYAEDDIYYGDFMGEEYPIYPINPDIDYLGSVDGFTYKLYLNVSGVYTPVTIDLELSDLSVSTFRLWVFLPDDTYFEPGNVYRVTVSGTYAGGVISAVDFIQLDLQGIHMLTVPGKVYNNSNSYSLSASNILPYSKSKQLVFEFDLKPNDTLWGIRVTDVQVDLISSSDAIVEDIGSNVGSILDYIKNLPSNIANSIKGFFDSVVNAIVKVDNAITSLPAKIKESLTSLFTSVVNAVNNIASSVANKFTSIFSSWFETDSELDGSVSDGSGVVDDVGSAESDLIEDALGDINGIDFSFDFSADLISALFFLLPFQDRLFNSFGILKDVIVISMTVGLVTLLLGRGLKALGNYGR